MRFVRRFAYWLKFGANEKDLREEIEHHRRLVAADLERRGFEHDAAQHAARRAMGNETYMREQARAVWLAPTLDAVVQDWRYSWRGLRRSPAFAAVAVASLALGIGANTAIFGLIHGLLLARLPVPAAAQLVQLRRDLGVTGGGIDDGFSRAEADALVSGEGPTPLAEFISSQASLEIDGVASNVSTDAVGGRYFDLLALHAARGRLFSAAEESQSAPVVVLTDRFWRGRLNGDPAVIGRTIKISGQSFSIIGVTPAGFAGVRFPAFAELFIPLRSALAFSLIRGDDRRPMLAVIGRRAESQSLEGAQRELASLWNRCCAAGQLVTVPAGRTTASRLTLADVSRGIPNVKMDLRGQFARILLALMGGVGVLLLAACANVANLLLARSSARAGELAMRLALGASRSRLVAQLVIESLQLSLLGAIAGVGLAWWGTTLLMRDRIGDLSLVVHSNPGAPVLAFTTLVSVVSGVVFGVVPALRVMRIDLVTPLSNAGRRAAGKQRGLIDRGLVALQMAFAVLLVSGAALMVQTLRNLQEADLGFEPSQRLALTVETRRTSYERPGMTSLLADEMLRRTRAIPGVRTAAFASLVPVFGGRGSGDNVTVPGAPPPPDGDPSTSFVGITPDYFTTLGIPLIAGRDIGPPVAGHPQGVVREVVVNDLFVKKFFADRNPIGQVFRDADDGDTTFTADRVVGVVGSAKFADPRSPARAMYFVPIADGDWPYLALVMRVSTAAAPIVASTSQIISAIAPGIGRGDPVLLAASIDAALARERMAAALATLFGAIALSLVAVGFYGVMLFQVTERTTEIGIRIALGANRTTVVALVLRQSLAIVAVGITVGIPLALAAARAVSSQLYGVEPYSLSTLLVSTAVLVSVAAVACLVPVLRAVRIDPLTALRAM